VIRIEIGFPQPRLDPPATRLIGRLLRLLVTDGGMRSCSREVFQVFLGEPVVRELLQQRPHELLSGSAHNTHHQIAARNNMYRTYFCGKCTCTYRVRLTHWLACEVLSCLLSSSVAAPPGETGDPGTSDLPTLPRPISAIHPSIPSTIHSDVSYRYKKTTKRNCDGAYGM
jgi:hypothetical protein